MDEMMTALLLPLLTEVWNADTWLPYRVRRDISTAFHRLIRQDFQRRAHFTTDVSSC